MAASQRNYVRKKGMVITIIKNLFDHKTTPARSQHKELRPWRRKVITNLHSILKSRGITFPTKVYLIKAMVFPVVMNGCESWTVKKAEL